jgi:hypothetical protein
MRIVEASERPIRSRRASLTSLLSSLTLHSMLAVLLWFLVYHTIEHQLISLTASETRGEVSMQLVASSTPAQPFAVPDQFAPVDSTVSNQSLISKFMETDARSPDIDFQPASIEFFGTRAYGNRFVFVLDISLSMGARDGQRFQRASDELLRSVSQLKRGQSYYVFLFCWRTEKMFYRPAIEYAQVGPGHLQKLRDWIHEVRLGGGTDPRRALSLARGLKPDALFLLSDGHFNEPDFYLSDTGWIDDAGARLEADVQQGVRSFFQATSIHTIAFENPFTFAVMQDIAKATGGKSRYVKTPSHQPIDSQRFADALQYLEKTYRSGSDPRQEYRKRLSYAREFIGEGELVYAEYLVRPLRDADRSTIINEALLNRILDILESELGDVRLEDFVATPDSIDLSAI